MEENTLKMESLSRERIIYIIDHFCGGNRMEFSKRAGIGKSSISQYVNGTNAPGNITASKIAAAFGVDPMWVMGFDVPMRKEDSSDITDLDRQIMEGFKLLPDDQKQFVLQIINNLKR